MLNKGARWLRDLLLSLFPHFLQNVALPYFSHIVFHFAAGPTLPKYKYKRKCKYKYKQNTNTNISVVSCSNLQLVRLAPAKRERQTSTLAPTHFKDDPPHYLCDVMWSLWWWWWWRRGCLLKIWPVKPLAREILCALGNFSLPITFSQQATFTQILTSPAFSKSQPPSSSPLSRPLLPSLRPKWSSLLRSFMPLFYQRPLLRF